MEYMSWWQFWGHWIKLAFDQSWQLYTVGAEVVGIIGGIIFFLYNKWKGRKPMKRQVMSRGLCEITLD